MELKHRFTHGHCCSARDLQTRRRRERQIVGSTNVEETNGQSKNTHTQDSESQGNCADLDTKTLTAGTLSLLRNLNGLVDKNTTDNVSCGVQSITTSPGESRMLRATALEVLERTLDEIAKNNRAMTIENNPKYLDAVLESLGLEGARDVPTPSVPVNRTPSHVTFSCVCTHI